MRPVTQRKGAVATKADRADSHCSTLPGRSLPMQALLGNDASKSPWKALEAFLKHWQSRYQGP